MGMVQRDVNEKMRGILVDWMVEVHIKFKLLTETMFLSVANPGTRRWPPRPIERPRLQLLGITAMLIARQVRGDLLRWRFGDFIFVATTHTNETRSCAASAKTLDAIKFGLTSPSALHFLRRFSKAAKETTASPTRSASTSSSSRCWTTSSSSTSRPQIAAGAVYLARRILDSTPYWNATLEHYTRYSEAQGDFQWHG